MDQIESRHAHPPEPSSDDVALPFSLQPQRDARPRSADSGGELISDQLGGYVPVTRDALGRRRRCDGLTPERQVVFLDALARCGVAADAARAAGVSRDTVYNLRNRAEGRAFSLGWDAAMLMSRGRVSDELHSRALNGVVDKIYRNGELWGERHRYDNRLTMAVLTRLDRVADGLGEGAATARIVAQEWDQFLDILEFGGDGAGDFLASRAAKVRIHAEEAEPAAGEAWARVAEDVSRSLEKFERLFAYSMFGGGLDGEADMTGLDLAAMEDWTENEWDRAERGGLLDSLRAHEWPEAVREPDGDDTDGTCRSRQDIPAPRPGAWARAGLARARREYARRFPPAAPSAFEQSGGWDNTHRQSSSEGGAE
ncbi:MAG TPA: hypothetical protein VD846_10555 [Allosphingosinicella sp.]|nr:hypothetical protein [Allosphingosinicella sp.]